MALLDEIEDLYAPRDHPVFQLVPPAFEQRAQDLYTIIGRPAVSSDTFWTVYLQLLGRFRALQNDPELTHVLECHREMTQRVEDEEIGLLPGLRELRNGDNVVGPHGEQYIGGSQDPPIPQCMQGGESNTQGPPIVPEYTVFTDDEDSEDSDSEEMYVDDSQ
jgi:hypothetical protein